MYKSLRLEEKQEPKLGTAWVPFLKVFSNIVGHNDPKWGSIRECMAGGGSLISGKLITTSIYSCLFHLLQTKEKF